MTVTLGTGIYLKEIQTGSGKGSMTDASQPVYPTTDDVIKTINALVDGWCERRCLLALRQVLGAWPLANPLTDGWGALLNALKDVRAFAAAELTAEESKRLGAMITAVTIRVSR